MIERYTRKKMGKIWSQENRWDQMLKVEKAVAFVQAKAGLIPQDSGKAIYEKSSFSSKKIYEFEKKTKHDVTAFVQSVAHSLGKTHGKYVHYRLTSSDVLDTALSLQILQSRDEIQKGLKSLKKTLKELVLKHKKTVCAGRTHGIHAEPTTFGFKLLSFLQEVTRAEQSFIQVCKEHVRGAVSGPVGNYSQMPESIEEQVCKKLNLKPEAVSTQVIPRDRHARILFSLNLITSSLERMAVEFRHLQRTEVAEVVEGFSKGQEGSSSMPHKKNPISAENITGLSRLLRSYLQSSQENQALWHERDISHSSVERVIFPDSFILCDYAISRMTELLKNLKVDKNRMKQNMENRGGEIFSAQVLSFLVSKKIARSEAYKWVQQVTHSKKQSLCSALLKQKKWARLPSKEVKSIFSGEKIASRIGKIIDKKLKAL